MAVTVSFIIPSYNSLKTLPKTVESILKQAGDQFEIIVVDSSDNELAKKQVALLASDRVKVIVLEKKTIPSEGRNIGARAASGQLLCFIDSDVILADDWLKEVLLAYQQGCRAGGGAIGIPEFQKDNLLAVAQLYLQFNEYLGGTARAQKLFVPSCNMFCDRALFFEVGGFPNIRASEDTLFFCSCKIKLRFILCRRRSAVTFFANSGKGFCAISFFWENM